MSGELCFRRVDVEKDAQQIADIYRYYVEDSTATFDCLPPTYQEMKEMIMDISSEFPFFVGECNGRILAYCYAHRWKQRDAYSPTVESTIYVRKEAQGRGIGLSLMHLLINACRREGFFSIIACITAENEESCRFHESLGFNKVSHFRKVGQKFGRMLDVVDYQFMLS